MKKLSVRDLCQIGIFASVICVSAQLSVPMPYGVPMTLQTLAIPLAGIILGAKKGGLSVLAYILLGAFGVPVFSGFKGGLGVILGATGGFIISFPLMAVAAGLGAAKNNKIWLFSGLIAGALINYTCGALYYSLVMSAGLAAAFYACVLPFIPTAVLKVILSAVLGKSVKAALIKHKALV